MKQAMTTTTERNDFKPESGIVPQMMMVMRGYVSALAAFLFPDFGKDASLDRTDYRMVSLCRLWILFVPLPKGCFISFVTCARRLLVSFLIVFLFEFFYLGTASVLLRYGLLANLAIGLASIASLSVSVELIQRLDFAALSTRFCFHKNASCQLGVSACV